MSTIEPDSSCHPGFRSATEQAVLDWVERFVIGLDLCPFARHSFESDAIHTTIAPDDIESALTTLALELERLVVRNAASGATTLILLCREDGSAGVAADFDDYLDLFAMAEDLVEVLGYSARVQLASFHPEYVFADVDMNDPANWSNRSPVPLIHLLLEDAVTEALEHHPDPEAIPERNVKRLRALGLEGMRRL